MAKHGRLVIVKTKRGKNVRLLNPAQKANKAKLELKTGVKYTNWGEVKLNPKTGQEIVLSEKERAYRAGQVAQSIDNAKAFYAKTNSKRLNPGGPDNDF